MFKAEKDDESMVTYQSQAKAIATPVDLGQVVLQGLGHWGDQIGVGKDLHAAGGALVTPRCCVGRQSGLAGVQAVPMKDICNIALIANVWIEIYSMILTVADQTHTIALLQSGAAQGAVGDVVAVPQPLQIRLDDALKPTERGIR